MPHEQGRTGQGGWARDAVGPSQRLRRAAQQPARAPRHHSSCGRRAGRRAAGRRARAWRAGAGHRANHRIRGQCGLQHVALEPAVEDVRGGRGQQLVEVRQDAPLPPSGAAYVQQGVKRARARAPASLQRVRQRRVQQRAHQVAHAAQECLVTSVRVRVPLGELCGAQAARGEPQRRMRPRRPACRVAAPAVRSTSAPAPCRLLPRAGRACLPAQWTPSWHRRRFPVAGSCRPRASWAAWA